MLPTGHCNIILAERFADDIRRASFEEAQGSDVRNLRNYLGYQRDDPSPQEWWASTHVVIRRGTCVYGFMVTCHELALLSLLGKARHRRRSQKISGIRFFFIIRGSGPTS
eukprot:2621855-Pyramimonas_sp.AAC.1